MFDFDSNFPSLANLTTSADVSKEIRALKSLLTLKENIIADPDIAKVLIIRDPSNSPSKILKDPDSGGVGVGSETCCPHCGETITVSLS